MNLQIFGIDMHNMHVNAIQKGKRGLNAVFRWVLHRYFLTIRAMTLGVRGVVVDEDGRVLLVRHGYLPGWHLPGGGVEIGETLLAALGREVWEEGGVRIVGEPQLHGVFLNEKLGRRDHVAVYVIRDFIWEGAPPPTREIRESGFFAVDALPAATTAATRARLAETLDETPRAATW
jgi:ADP-ribose pyrophosphatase YjhB (NUDIX family)